MIRKPGHLHHNLKKSSSCSCPNSINSSSLSYFQRDFYSGKHYFIRRDSGRGIRQHGASIRQFSTTSPIADREYSLESPPQFFLKEYQRWYFLRIILQRCFGVEDVMEVFSLDPPITMRQIKDLNTTHGINGAFFAEAYSSLLDILLQLFPEHESQWVKVAPYPQFTRQQWDQHSFTLKERLESDVGITNPEDWLLLDSETLKRRIGEDSLPLHIYNIHKRVEILRKWYPQQKWELYHFLEIQHAKLRWLEVLLGYMFPDSAVTVTSEGADHVGIVHTQNLAFILSSQESYSRSNSVIIPLSWDGREESLLRLMREQLGISQLEIHRSTIESESILMEPHSTDFLGTSEWQAVVCEGIGTPVRTMLNKKGDLHLRSGLVCQLPTPIQDLLKCVSESIDLDLVCEVVLNTQKHETPSAILLHNVKSVIWWRSNARIIVHDVADEVLSYDMRYNLLNRIRKTVREIAEGKGFAKLVHIPPHIPVNHEDDVDQLFQAPEAQLAYCYRKGGLYTPGRGVEHFCVRRRAQEVRALFVSLSEEGVMVQLPYGARVRISAGTTSQLEDWIPEKTILRLGLTKDASLCVISAVHSDNLIAWSHVMQNEENRLQNQLQSKREMTPQQRTCLTLCLREKLYSIDRDARDNLLLLFLAQNPFDLYPTEADLYNLSKILGVELQALREMLKYVRRRIRAASCGAVTDESRSYLIDWQSKHLDSPPTVQELQNLCDETSLSQAQVLYILDLPGEQSKENLKFVEEWAKEHRTHPSHTELQWLKQRTGLSLAQIRSKIHSIHDSPGEISTQVKQQIHFFLQERDFNRLSKTEFQSLKSLTSLSSTQLSHQLKVYMDPARRDVDSAHVRIVETWLLKHRRRPTQDEFVQLKELSGLSSKQLSERIRFLLQPPRESAHHEVRQYLFHWLERHNFREPTDEEMITLMRECHLHRRQLQQKLRYLLKSHKRSLVGGKAIG